MSCTDHQWQVSHQVLCVCRRNKYQLAAWLGGDLNPLKRASS